MTDIVVKTLGENLLDEQAIELVRMRLAEGKTLDQALLIGGLVFKSLNGKVEDNDIGPANGV
jgi:hypothetical protein